jgi:hypothetical protein
MVSTPPPDKVPETLRTPSAHRSPASSAAPLTRDAGIGRRRESLPWAIVQHGCSAKGVFQVVPASECEEPAGSWGVESDAKEAFWRDMTTVVDYFRTQEEAEQFLTTFALPLATMLPHVWPPSIEEPLRQWYAVRKGIEEHQGGTPIGTEPAGPQAHPSV